MKVFYSAKTLANHFATVTTYEIGGRRVALMIGQVKSFVISAIDAHATTHENDPNGEPVHQILAEMRIESHETGDGETQYSAEGYWQAEDFNAEAMESLMRANLAARCDIKLIEGEELAKAKAAAAEARRLQMYKIMRQEPPVLSENI